eukprot:GHVL01042131.1.p1 GENE.GHVL01042131.1~~GHVL01042131.1.p1  ORF type:complete len:460 (+),score=110.80 GHVL01042131.1:44-1423(+)
MHRSLILLNSGPAPLENTSKFVSGNIRFLYNHISDVENSFPKYIPVRIYPKFQQRIKWKIRFKKNQKYGRYGHVQPHHGEASMKDLEEVDVSNLGDFTQKAGKNGIKNDKFWDILVMKLRESRDIMKIKDVVKVLVGFESANRRYCDLLKLYVREFTDDAEKLSNSDISTVLRIYSYFNINSFELNIKLFKILEMRLPSKCSALIIKGQSISALKLKFDDTTVSNIFTACNRFKIYPKSLLDGLTNIFLKDMSEERFPNNSFTTILSCIADYEDTYKIFIKLSKESINRFNELDNGPMAASILTSICRAYDGKHFDAKYRRALGDVIINSLSNLQEESQNLPNWLTEIMPDEDSFNLKKKKKREREYEESLSKFYDPVRMDSRNMRSLTISKIVRSVLEVMRNEDKASKNTNKQIGELVNDRRKKKLFPSKKVIEGKSKKKKKNDDNSKKKKKKKKKKK